MIPFIERSALLRTVNYMRVSHPYALRYNVIYPALLTAVSFLLLNISGSMNIFGRGGFISSFSQLLAVLAPFYLASVAAVSTFGGSTEFLDSDFQMSAPVTLVVAGERGGVREINVKPRHFLALLFCYCCIVSLILFLVTIFSPFIADMIHVWFPEYREYLGFGALLFFLFFFYQVVTSTVLGLYVLGDRLHR